MEPQRYLTALLEELRDCQEQIDSYMGSGDGQHLAPIWKEGNNLPVEFILHWAYENKFNRFLMTDTRNQTMTDAVLAAYRIYAGARIVAYGGQMHMMKGGRYRFDAENRTPVGSRLLRAGITEAELFSILLDGRGRFPLDSVWKHTGAVSTNGPMGQLPFELFINYPVFGVTRADELFDVFVNLGELTEIP